MNQLECQKSVVFITVLMLLISSGLMVMCLGSALGETRPDYEYTYNLASDGSDDTAAEYDITRANTSKSGSIVIKAWKEEKRVDISLTNISYRTILKRTRTQRI